MKRELILNGFRIGEYRQGNEEFYEVFRQKYVEGMNYVGISTFPTDNKTGDPLTQENYIDWARFLAGKKIYFYFTGGGNRREVGFTEETVKKAKEHGILCNVFYADDAEEAKRYLDMGIDTILTNDYHRIAISAQTRSQ